MSELRTLLVHCHLPVTPNDVADAEGDLHQAAQNVLGGQGARVILVEELAPDEQNEQ